MDSDQPVVGTSEVKTLGERVCELSSVASAGGRDPPRGSFQSQERADIAADLVAEGRFPMKSVADVLGVSRSNLVERLKGTLGIADYRLVGIPASAPPSLKSRRHNFREIRQL